MKTLIGIVTFSNLGFTKLCVRSMRETTTKQFDLFVVVGKHGDNETRAWLDQENIPHVVHQTNMGFPSSLNDIYDYGWKHNDYDNIIIAGNDIIAYPGAIDAMIAEAETSEWEWISACQFDVRNLIARYPETRQYFTGPTCAFNAWDQRPWEIHKDIRPPRVQPNVIWDVHNLCLFKRSVMEKIGYIDVNFFPAYFSDNDYCNRGTYAGLKTCSLDHAAYFHFWSRTIHQGEGGSTPKYFVANEEFYVHKWGGKVREEQWRTPFGGKPFELKPGVILPASLKINNRADEQAIVEYWKNR